MPVNPAAEIKDEKVFRIEVKAVGARDWMVPDGSEHTVRIWRGWGNSTSANAEHFTTDQLRDYVARLNEYVEGL